MTSSYKSGLTRQPGFRPAKNATFDKQRDEFDQQARRNQDTMRQSIRDSNSVREANVRQGEKELEALSTFSETALTILQDKTKERNESERQRGIMLAYTDGLPQEEVEQFDREEEEARKIDEQAVALGDKLEKRTGNVFVGQKARNLSGWAQYGYAQGLAQRGGADYNTYLLTARENEQVTIQTPNGPKTLTLAAADDPAEYNAVQSQLRNNYLKKYNNINPALLNKYMFPDMQRAEQRDATVWAAQRASEIKQERADKSFAAWQTGIRQGNIQGATEQWLTEYGRVNGRKAARAELVRNMQSMIAAGGNNDAAVKAMLNVTVEAADGSGRKTLAELFPELSERVVNGWISQREVGIYNDNENAEKMADAQRKDEFEALVKKAAATGVPLTNAQIEELKQDFRKDTGREPPEYFDQYKTFEDRDDQQDIDRIEDILANGRGYLLESDLEGTSYEVRTKFNNQLKADQALAVPNKDFLKEANEKAKALTVAVLKGEIGTADARTNAYVDHVRRANLSYKKYYREEIRKGNTPQQAHLNSLSRMQENAKALTYTIPDGVGTPRGTTEQVLAGDKFMRENPDDWKTTTIPGMAASLNELKENMQSDGPIRIPQAYQALAETRKDMTAWDIADAQLRAATGEGLRPNRKVEAVNAMTPDVQRLLKFKPTINRTRRASIQSGDQAAFLNLVASEESAAYGDYDAYNLGGSNDGHTANGSGNSNDLRFGKPLTAMTVGEVIGLQNQGKIHATGRYQFVKGSLSDTAQYAGIPMDAPYNAATQDALAMARMKWRHENDPGIAGWKREWVGLNDVPDYVLRQHYNTLNRPTYDQPQNMTPGVGITRDLGKFSSQVSSVTYDTGQPGIDLFFEDKQFPAVLPGRVKEISSQYNSDGSGYGNYIVVESIDPTTGQPVDVLYGHLESPAKYKAGQTINTGQIIGRQGGTGSVQSYDGTIASIDFLAPAPAGSKSMTPYMGYDALRRSVAQQFGK